MAVSFPARIQPSFNIQNQTYIGSPKRCSPSGSTNTLKPDRGSNCFQQAIHELMVSDLGTTIGSVLALPLVAYKPYQDQGVPKDHLSISMLIDNLVKDRPDERKDFSENRHREEPTDITQDKGQKNPVIGQLFQWPPACGHCGNNAFSFALHGLDMFSELVSNRRL